MLSKDYSVERVKHRIERVRCNIKNLEAIDTLSLHGKWTLGYFQGKLSILEDLLDCLEEVEE